MATALFVIAIFLAVFVIWRFGASPAAAGSSRPEGAKTKEILLAPFVVVYGVLVGLALGVVDGIVEGLKKPAPRRVSPPDAPCGGIAEGCPVCLAASVALGVMVGDWLSGH